jgi:hypothetical protein
VRRAPIPGLEEARFIHLDLFPATVTPENTPEEALGEEYRIIVTDNHLYGLLDGDNGPTVDLKAPLTGFHGNSKSGYVAETGNGIFRIIRTVDCGCGSRLLGATPFLGTPHISQMPPGTV